MKQKIFLKGFLITFCEIFLQGFGNIYLHFQFYKKPWQEIFFKPFRNISRNVTLLEKVCKKNFGETF